MFYRHQAEIKRIPPSVDRPIPTERLTALQIKSSIPYWDQQKAFESFKTNITKHNFVNLFWYYITDANTIAKYAYAVEDRSIIDLAHNNNVKVFATITNLPEEGGWDTKRVESMLRTKSSRGKHIEDIVTKLNELEFDGVNIDYEEVDAKEKERFTLFISELASTLHKDSKLLSISLHPKRAGSMGLGAFQDWRRLSDYADQMTIMAFNEHYDEGDAGPIASIPWLEKIVAYAQFQKVPGEKIYLGIPLFGYDWDHDNSDAATGLTFDDVLQILNEQRIGNEWDDTSKSPYFTYTKNGDDHEVWYENAKSVKEKIDLAERIGLAGVSFWRLGGEDPKIWQEL